MPQGCQDHLEKDRRTQETTDNNPPVRSIRGSKGQRRQLLGQVYWAQKKLEAEQLKVVGRKNVTQNTCCRKHAETGTENQIQLLSLQDVKVGVLDEQQLEGQTEKLERTGSEDEFQK